MEAGGALAGCSTAVGDPERCLAAATALQSFAPGEGGGCGAASGKGFDFVVVEDVEAVDLEGAEGVDECALGVAGNTLVLFTSDNGPEEIVVGSAGHSGVGSPGPFRGRKRSLE
jgi:hypothetical protein